MKAIAPCEKVLVVEDDEGVAYLQRQRLERMGYTVLTAGDCEQAMHHAKAGVDVVVLDYCLGNVIGLDVCEQLKAAGLDLPVVMVTGFSEESTVIKALRSGVRDFVPKTSQYLEYLPQAIDRVLRQARTEKQLLESEERRRQGQKMEALGQLAGGVAHEFNNLLQIIQGFAECVIEEHGDQPGIGEDLGEVLKATARAANLTGQLLAFGRRQPMQMEPIDLQSMIHDLMKMVRPLLGEHVEVKVRLDEQLGYVLGDGTMIGQAIMNLCVNARDAMDDGGQLTIECANVSLDEAFCQQRDRVRPGPHVRVRVSDTGTGIAPEHLSHLYEPFFTTKPVGQGTGLGLATVFGVVEEHAACIEVESQLGQGTTFTLYLPQSDRAPRDQATRPAKNDSGAETILLAEDETRVRHFLERILSRAGYRVLTAGDGEEAIDVFREHQEEIGLVLLDMVMPKQLGRAAYEAIRGIRPDVKAAFISGYDPEARHFDFEGSDKVPVLQKPIRRQSLLRVVRQLLDGAAPQAEGHVPQDPATGAPLQLAFSPAAGPSSFTAFTGLKRGQ